MVVFNYKTKDKLLQTKLHMEANLCRSLFARVWSFVFIHNYKNHMKKLLLSGLFALLLFPLVSSAAFDVSLKYGSRGQAVEELQDFLQDQGFLTGKIDGKFGFGTLRAVKAFQTANGLSSDGYFGKASRSISSTILATDLKISDNAEKSETGLISDPAVQISPITQTNDVNTQAKLDALSNQVSTLTTQLQKQLESKKIITQQSVVFVTEPLKFTSMPQEGGVGPCTKCIWVGTNNPSKVTIVVDGVSYTTEGLFKDHYFLEFADVFMDPADGGHKVGTYAATNLNLDGLVSHTFDVVKTVAIDQDGNSIVMIPDATYLTIPKK